MSCPENPTIGCFVILPGETEPCQYCADCVPHAKGVARAYDVPVTALTQSMANDTARKTKAPAFCFACGRFLTAIVDGPDPRD